MGHKIRIFGPHLAAASVVGAVLALAACKKSDNATSDSAMSAMATPADSSATMTPPSAASAAPTDAQIFAQLSAANWGEVDAGKMAETKATNADVKAFARMMVTDHGKMLSDVRALAKRLNITPDTAAADSIRMANQAMASTLTAAEKGITFDTAYVNGQVMGHQNTLATLNTAVTQAQSSDLKKAINDAIPTVQRHLDRIKDIQGKMQ